MTYINTMSLLQIDQTIINIDIFFMLLVSIATHNVLAVSHCVL